MRLLVTTTGHPGHVLPVVPFARACLQAGHEVCVVGPRSAGAVVRDLGLEFCGVADPPDDVRGRILAAAAELPPGDGHAFMVAEGFGRAATRAVLREVVQMVGAWRPDVVVRESQEFSGYLAAERHGVPHVRVDLGLASTEQETQTLVAGAMDELRAELGLPPDPDGTLLNAGPSLTLAPAALEQPEPSGAHATHRFRVPRAPAAPLPDWWPGNTDPLVYVTFGSVAASLGYFPTLYRAACEAVAKLPARVLVTVGAHADPAELGPLPPNVHVERWVAQALVARHAAAVVCHGGYGSVLGALAHGLPVVAVPLFAGDQWHNARRVAQIGAGVALEDARRTMFDHPGADVLAALPGAVARVLEDAGGHRAAAQRVAAEIDDLPPVDAAADVLRAFADGVPARHYVLGRTREEYERLREQARMWEPETARLLERVGLAPGARCLDVGCGPGETMRLMAERVGPGGQVTGVDVDAPLGAQAVGMLHGAGHRQCRFEAVDVESDAAMPGAPFDLVFARLLLLHADEPVTVLRRLWDWVAPGGHLVVQDYDLLTGEVVPAIDVVEEFKGVALGTFRAAGRDLRLGLRLPALHVEAGIGAPDGIDVGARVGLLPDLAPMYEAVYRSLLPSAVTLGLTTQAQSDRWFDAFADDSARADAHAALWPLLIGTWKRRTH